MTPRILHRCRRSQSFACCLLASEAVLRLRGAAPGFQWDSPGLVTGKKHQQIQKTSKRGKTGGCVWQNTTLAAAAFHYGRHTVVADEVRPCCAPVERALLANVLAPAEKPANKRETLAAFRALQWNASFLSEPPSPRTHRRKAAGFLRRLMTRSRSTSDMPRIDSRICRSCAIV